MEIIEDVDKRMLEKAERIHINWYNRNAPVVEGDGVSVDDALAMVKTGVFKVYKWQLGYVNIGTSWVRTTSKYTIELCPKA